MKSIKTLIAPVVIAAVAVTGISAAQARAETSDLAKVLFGVATVAVIASAIDNNQKNKRAEVSVTTNRYPRIIAGPERHGHKRVSYALPSRCLQTYEGRRGERQLYAGRCLKRVDYKLAKLPKACAYTVVTRRGRDLAYGPRCLARHGFYRAQQRHTGNPRIIDTPRDRHISWGD